MREEDLDVALRSIIEASHDLGFQVVAEEIETATADEMLQLRSCDEGQGFLT